MYLPGRYQYQMGYTLPEFARTLGGHLTSAPLPWRLEILGERRWKISHIEKPFDMQIDAEVLQPRRIALLELPVLKVIFTPLDCNAETEAKFFDNFFKHFQKGGG